MARRDRSEFIGFAEACRPALRRTAYLMCGDWDWAADITQEALTRVYVAWPRLDQDRGLRAYARRAVVSVAIEQKRKRSSRETPVADVGGPVVEDPSGQVVDRLFLLAVLAELPPRQRACVVLRFYEDLSVEAVAEALGCRAGTVKSQTARGLDALRAAYAARGGELRTPPAPPPRAHPAEIDPEEARS
jgi:RNA polymerase sigma-70 factor (sigma-E family)